MPALGSWTVPWGTEVKGWNFTQHSGMRILNSVEDPGQIGGGSPWKVRPSVPPPMWPELEVGGIGGWCPPGLASLRKALDQSTDSGLT